MKKKNNDYKIKSWFLIFVILFETAFAGFTPASADVVSENTIVAKDVSQNAAPIKLKPVNEQTEQDSEEAFTGVSARKSGDLTWSVSADGHLKIEGTGDYNRDYLDNYYPSWVEYSDYIKTAEVNVTGITDMYYMFASCSNLKSIDFKNTDTSKVDNMYGMFKGCYLLEEINLSSFDTSNVETMCYMFGGCYAIKKIDLSNFNTSKVENMASMFSSCELLEEINLSSFNTSNVKDIGWMFNGCDSLKEIDLSNFNTSNVREMDYLFAWCSSLKKLDLSAFKTENVTTMDSMFMKCTSLKELNISGFNTRNVTTMADMFYECTSLERLIINNNSFDTGNVTNFACMFYKCNKLSNLDVSNFNTEKATDFSLMFSQCQTLKSLNLSNFNTENATDMAAMFSDCKSLTALDLSNFKTPNVNNMSSMFNGCTQLQELDISGFDTSNVQYMGGMFADTAIKELDLKHFDTSNVTNMEKMFYSCYELEKLDISTFNTSKVTNMREMFRAAWSLKKLDLKNFNTQNVTDMYDMFYLCESLEILDVSSFDTSNVTNMGGMFCANRVLKKLDVSNFDTRNVTTMSWMFCHCTSLEEIDVSNFNTTNVTDINTMFAGCNKLVSLDLSSFDTSNVTDMSSIVGGCDSLKELDISNFDTSNYTVDKSFYIEIDSLEKFVSSKDTRVYKIISTADKWIDDFGNIYPDHTDIELKPNTTLYRINDSYSINYVYDGELLDAQDTYNFDETLSLTGHVNKPGYTFAGWYFNEKYTKKVTEITAGTFGDITLYAKLNPETYSITYQNLEDVTNIDKLPVSYTSGKNLQIETPLKTCYLFDGWYLNKELTNAFNGITANSFGDLILFAKWKENHEVDKANGVITKEATTTSEGEIRYQCKNCTYTETEVIPRIVTEESQITDSTIIDNPDDGDIKGSDFTKIQARADKTTKTSIRLKWNRIEGADGYKIYGNKCGKKNKYEIITDIKNVGKTTWTQKKRKKGTYYKYIVRAYKIVDGEEITVAISKTIHATTTGGKRGNAKAVSIKTDKKCKKTKAGYTLTLKKGKSYKIKASEVKKDKKINIHRNIRFESIDKDIATVSKGVVKAKAKGTTYLYAYAQNGVYSKIKVVVK